MQNIIVCDDFVGDALTDVAVELGEGEGPKVVRLSAFLKNQGIVYDRQNGELRKKLGAGKDKWKILDRVVEISPETAKKLDGDDEILQRGQVFFQYENALKANGAQHDVKQYTAVGKLLPLPTQWHLIEISDLKVEVPSYLYGYGPTPVDLSKIDQPIFKSPFELYKWQKNEEPDDEIWDQFVVEAPSGMPILTYFLSHDIHAVHSLRQDEYQLDDDMADVLLEMSIRVGSLFGSTRGEILWYVDGHKIVFAAFSHFLSGAAEMGSFRDNATRFFHQYFGQ